MYLEPQSTAKLRVGGKAVGEPSPGPNSTLFVTIAAIFPLPELIIRSGWGWGAKPGSGGTGLLEREIPSPLGESD